MGKTPLFLSRVSAGFPSPADDYIEKALDLEELLVENKAATFFVRVEGDSMLGARIHSGDILVVDRSKEPADGRIVIAVLDGELTVKRIKRDKRKLYLMPENDAYAPIEVSKERDLVIWGVVTSVIHPV
jgi:DNA polymerase V